VVIAAFLALLLSTLSVLRSIGPALAIAVAVTLVAGLTRVPAVVSLPGPRVFWPSRSWRREHDAARFAAIGRSLGRRPAAYAIVSGLVLAVRAIGAFAYKPTFDLSSAGIPAHAESQTALKTLEEGLPPGATDPTVVLLHNTSGQPLTAPEASSFGARLKTLPGVGAVAPPTQSADHATVAYSVTLSYNPQSTATVNVVKNQLRPAVHAAAPAGSYALVGGTTAVFADIQRAVNHDYAVVFPTAAIIILLILGLLLRSVVAPWYLLASVVLGFVWPPLPPSLVPHRQRGRVDLGVDVPPPVRRQWPLEGPPRPGTEECPQRVTQAAPAPAPAPGPFDRPVVFVTQRPGGDRAEPLPAISREHIEPRRPPRVRWQRSRRTQRPHQATQHVVPVSAQRHHDLVPQLVVGCLQQPHQR